jgi:hypothetical protein
MQRNCERGKELMTRNEYNLMYKIRTNDNPTQAMITAIKVICQYIMQPQSSPKPSVADPPGSDEKVSA